jgi:hypothetical protein
VVGTKLLDGLDFGGTDETTAAEAHNLDPEGSDYAAIAASVIGQSSAFARCKVAGEVTLTLTLTLAASGKVTGAGVEGPSPADAACLEGVAHTLSIDWTGTHAVMFEAALEF